MNTNPLPFIFINYRRSDGEAFAAALKPLLESQFGEGTVFLDNRDIDLGTKWDEELESALKNTKVFLSLIGEKWLKAQDQYGNRRLDNSEDWVRIEIETALSQDYTEVIIIQLENFTVPPIQAFSKIPTLLPLLKRQALPPIGWSTLYNDIKPLINTISKITGDKIELFSKNKNVPNLLKEYPISDAILELPLPEKPYQRFNYFKRDTSRLFFGREEEVLKLIVLIERPDISLLLFHGHSGVGKSSLLLAGVLPRLEHKWKIHYHRR